MKSSDTPKPETRATQRIRDLLSAHGIRPRKTWGQNFLTDANFARAIARTAAPDDKTLVLEIGPGTGALTRTLLDSHPKARVLAVELDDRLMALLEDSFSQECEKGRLTLLSGDALQSKHALNPEWTAELLRISRTERRPRRILCANLPYQIAAPLIANIATPDEESEEEALCERIIATIQLELAERLLGKPGTRDYGPLAAYLSLRAHGRILRRIGPEAFWPRPKVSSAVLDLCLLPWKHLPFQPEEAIHYSAFLQTVFRNRRKTLRSILRGSLDPADERGSLRAERLEPAELLRLFREIEAG